MSSTSALSLDSPDEPAPEIRLAPRAVTRGRAFPENLKTGVKYLRDRVRELSFDARVTSQIRHLHGPRKLDTGPDDVIVTCLVKNGEFWIRSFIDHYVRLGARHIVFMDNDSTDRTVAIAREYPNVSILSSKAKLGLWLENAHRRVMLRRYCQGRWCINVDIDEYFDYPHSDRISLTRLVRYLRDHSYNAVVGQLLDVFAKKQLSIDDPDSPPPATVDELKKAYPYYDLGDLTTRNYLDGWYPELISGNEVSNPEILFIQGGVRLRVFGTEVCLTKHPLIHYGSGIQPFTNAHCAARARVADFSGVLYHYKLIANFTKNLKTYLSERYGWLGIYEASMKKLKESGRVSFESKHTRELGSVDELLPSGFIVTSPKFAKALLP